MPQPRIVQDICHNLGGHHVHALLTDGANDAYSFTDSINDCPVTGVSFNNRLVLGPRPFIHCPSQILLAHEVLGIVVRCEDGMRIYKKRADSPAIDNAMVVAGPFQSAKLCDIDPDGRIISIVGHMTKHDDGARVYVDGRETMNSIHLTLRHPAVVLDGARHYTSLFPSQGEDFGWYVLRDGGVRVAGPYALVSNLVICEGGHIHLLAVTKSTNELVAVSISR